MVVDRYAKRELAIVGVENVDGVRRIGNIIHPKSVSAVGQENIVAGNRDAGSEPAVVRIGNAEQCKLTKAR
jgi:hypothetical protein